MSVLAGNLRLRFKEVYTQTRMNVGSMFALSGFSKHNKRENFSDSSGSQGVVHLIGAGPGDAELLTLKAYRAIQHAQVIVYDALVSEDVVAMFPASARKIYVGKRYAQHTMPQAEICRTLLELAKAGKRVVRVKGGDPAIFARVGEECALLAEHQIPFSVVPGITAASGASAYAGIPLTHRDCAQSVRFITAHLKDHKAEPDWASMVPRQHHMHGETLVFYMGLRRIELICQRLLAHGMPSNMPVAVIEHATHAEQRVCIGTVANIAAEVTKQGFSGPAITIVGRVVDYRSNVFAPATVPSEPMLRTVSVR